MPAGSTVPADWRFITSSDLGGDSFGYHWLSPHQLVIYLLDVCGHGVGSALLSVSALNTIRNRTLPETDFLVPSQVLAALNRLFPMEQQNGKYFTMFYGVFDLNTRQMVHASGGHPPAIAVAPDGSIQQMRSTGVMIGAIEGATFTDVTTTLAPGTRLFVFSDGCYEVVDIVGTMMTLADFTKLLATASTRPHTLDNIVFAAQHWQQHADFEDDFSLIEFQL